MNIPDTAKLQPPCCRENAGRNLAERGEIATFVAYRQSFAIMTDLTLLPRTNGTEPPTLIGARQVTLIGANGAGKTRFMKELMRRLPGQAYYLSALQATFPERHISTMEGSIDMLYLEEAKTKPYMRADAVSELDKLVYMLMADEFESLLSMKTRMLAGEEECPRPPRTRLDKLVGIWRRIFPNSQILKHGGSLMFANECSDDLIGPLMLSQGEKAVFYYIAATLYARRGSVIFIDSPTLFLHSAILNSLWNSIEALRPDCTFVYSTMDPDFVNSRTQNTCIWIRSFDASMQAWDYQVLDYKDITDDCFVDIIGSRKPVLFIEGDREHSIDAKLYTLVFQDYTVRPLGSCDKVIETTRTFNDLRRMHHLDSRGIVDRDRRTDAEVGYLRRKNVLVPEVAEVENIFLLEDIVKSMAEARGYSPEKVFRTVSNRVSSLFAERYEAQALEHVRHQMKRNVECRIDARFTCITALETHMRNLVDKLRPRDVYNQLLDEFLQMIGYSDYAGILRVFNYKPMLSECGVAPLLGYSNATDYISGVLTAMKGHSELAERLRNAVKVCFRLDEEPQPAESPAYRDRSEKSDRSDKSDLSELTRRQAKRKNTRAHQKPTKSRRAK